MLEEHVVLKAPRYVNENILIYTTLALVFLPALFYGGESLMAFSVAVSLSLLIPFNIISYPHNWIDAPKHSRRNFLLALSPYLFFFAFTCFRLTLPIFENVNPQDNSVYVINTENLKNIFACAYSDGPTAISSAIALLVVAAAGLSIYFITQSRFILRNMLSLCGFSVALLAIIAFVFDFLAYLGGPSLQYIFGENSFATFQNSQYWSYFAMIWSGALFASGIYTFQRFRPYKFFLSLRTGFIVLGLLLGISALYTASSFFRIFVCLQLAICFLVYAYNVLPTEKFLKKHTNIESRKNKRETTQLMRTLPFLVYFAFLALSFFGAIKAYGYYVENSKLPASQTLILNEKLIQKDTKSLIKVRPYFGWGLNSFESVIALEQGDDLPLIPRKSPRSDYLKVIFENGYLGIFILALTPAVFLLRLIYNRKISASGVIMLTTLLSIFFAFFYSTPFMSNSVAMSFSVLLFSLFRWENCEII